MVNKLTSLGCEKKLRIFSTRSNYKVYNRIFKNIYYLTLAWNFQFFVFSEIYCIFIILHYFQAFQLQRKKLLLMTHVEHGSAPNWIITPITKNYGDTITSDTLTLQYTLSGHSVCTESPIFLARSVLDIPDVRSELPTLPRSRASSRETGSHQSRTILYGGCYVSVNRFALDQLWWNLLGASFLMHNFQSSRKIPCSQSFV